MKTNKRTKLRKKNPVDRINRVKPKTPVRFDGTFLNSIITSGFVTTLANAGSLCIPIDCSNTNTGSGTPLAVLGAVSNLQGITSLYQTFVYEQLTINWVPSVAPGTTDAGSRIFMCYLENPEEITNAIAAAAATNQGISINSRNSVYFNAWEKGTFNVPLTRRKPKFDINTNITYTVDTTDRSVQGLVVVAAFGVNAVASLGQCQVKGRVRLSTLQTFIGT